MKKKIVFRIIGLLLILLPFSCTFYLLEYKFYYTVEDVTFTFWNTSNGCYIMPYKYTGLLFPKDNYLIVSPFIAFPFVNAKPYYIDGGIKVESRFAKVLGASLSTACIERIWRHELALFLDSRFFSLNFAASIASQGFARTFYTLSGLGFRFGIGIGL